MAACVDVVVVGNGPAGLCLSLLLSGYWPYFNGHHPDSVLKAKCNEHPGMSLVEQDLQHLSDGLEGRSHNPVALLLDALLLPNADVGERWPSTLRWERDDSRAIAHLVLGSGPAGGSWNEMSKHVTSLSPARWLELPGYSFSSWYQEQFGTPHEGEYLSVPLGDVAQYYRDYVEQMGLSDNIVNHVEVTSVRRTDFLSGPSIDSELNQSVSEESCLSSSALSDFDMDSCSSESSDDEGDMYSYFRNDWRHWGSGCAGDRLLTRYFLSHNLNDSCNGGGVHPQTQEAGLAQQGYQWCVSAKKTDGSDKDIQLYCKTLVLACGVNSQPRLLGVPGESLSLVSHTISDFYSKLMLLPPSSVVLVVGAGLTAADAVNVALERQLCVVHVYRQDVTNPSLVFNKLPSTLYKNYAGLFQLMKGKASDNHYTFLPRSYIKEFREDGCIVVEKSKQQRHIPTRVVGVFIGSEASLDFLSNDVLSKLSFDAAQPVSSKLNPVVVDPYTYECTRVPAVHAVGALVGDTLVRFIVGGALGVTHALHMQRQSN